MRSSPHAPLRQIAICLALLSLVAACRPAKGPAPDGKTPQETGNQAVPTVEVKPEPAASLEAKPSTNVETEPSTDVIAKPSTGAVTGVFQEPNALPFIEPLMERSSDWSIDDPALEQKPEEPIEADFPQIEFPSDPPITYPPLSETLRSAEELAVEGELTVEPDTQWMPPLEEPIDLGPPLVEHPDDLIRLDPKRPIWMDKKGRRVVVVGQVCQRNVPLELFACKAGTKEHEAIVTVDVNAVTIHTGLLAVGGKAGHPVRWTPEYQPATGTEIEITVVWKDAKGERKSARAQEWIRDRATGRPMAYGWVFAGSSFWKDERSGKRYYNAEGGDLICVSNFSTALLDLPIKSSQAEQQWLFEANTKQIPPLSTPVTLILKPVLKKKEANGKGDNAQTDNSENDNAQTSPVK